MGAHITAAAIGGPRYDRDLTPEQRSSGNNAIWLCQNCAKLIDNDEVFYTAGLLRMWKGHSELAADMVVGKPDKSGIDDRDILQFFTICLDRPAFNDVFYVERSTEDFDKALEDTITAFNTGTLRSRDGAVLQSFRGKSYVRNPTLRTMLDGFVDILRGIRARYAEAKRSGEVTVEDRHYGESFYYVQGPELAEWFESSRLQALGIFKRAADVVGVVYFVPTREVIMHRRMLPPPTQ